MLLSDREREWGRQEWLIRKGEGWASPAGRAAVYARQDRRIADSGLRSPVAYYSLILAQQEERDAERERLRHSVPRRPMGYC